MKLIFLCSGNGGNLKFIKTYFEFLNLGDVIYVLSDRECGANKYATDNQIPNKLISFKNEVECENILIEIMGKYNPDFIITNIHKIISPKIVSVFSGKLINLHYSILPAFKGFIGMKSLQKALELKSQFVGSTCHYVNEEIDSGKIISQSYFKVGDNIKIEQKMFQAGALTLLNGLLKLSNNKSISNFKYNEIEFNPSYDLNRQLISEIFNKLENDEF
jgi:phosphoribosylglycinamide formyltransferase-1